MAHHDGPRLAARTVVNGSGFRLGIGCAEILARPSAGVTRYSKKSLVKIAQTGSRR